MLLKQKLTECTCITE